jgi:hypothetical protein
MVYYFIKLYVYAQELCTIVFPWLKGTYKYKLIPMDIKIVWLLMLSKFPDDKLFITNSIFKDHLFKLEYVLERLSNRWYESECVGISIFKVFENT